MAHKFPENMTLSEVKEAIETHNKKLGCEVFFIVDKGYYFVANYYISHPHAFPEENTGDPLLDRQYAILRECRGLTFYPNGEIAILKYHKFFNVGERFDNQIHQIDFTKDHYITVKEDGSMISIFLRADGEIECHTKMGATDIAKYADDFIKNHPEYKDFSINLINLGFCPIFEFCSLKNKIVITYPEDHLILTAIRNKNTGEFMSYENMVENASKYSIEVVKSYSKSNNILEFVNYIKNLKGEEGVVFRFEDDMYKMKADDYLLKHHSKEICQLEKNVWKVILDETIDDILPLLDVSDRKNLVDFQIEFENRIFKLAKDLETEVNNYKKISDNKKDFAINYVSKKDKHLKSMLFSIWDNKNPIDVVKDFFLSNCSSQPSIDKVRYLLNDISWYETENIIK